MIRGTGNREATIAIVGGFPSSYDRYSGTPFSSSIGSTLSSLLHSAGINKADCYLTCVVKEFLSVAEAGKIAFQRSNIFSTKERYDYYENILLKELSSLPNLKMVITMDDIGYPDVALYALTRKITSLKRRGSVYMSNLVPNVKVLCTINPNSIFKDPLYSRLIALDLEKVNLELESPQLLDLEREFLLKPSFEQAKSFLLEVLEMEGEIGFDIEVDIKKQEMTCFSIATSPTRAISVPLVDRGINYLTLPQEKEIMFLLADILEKPTLTKVGQNILFDTTFLCRRYGIVINPLEDTMVAQALLLPDFPKGLDMITSLYTHHPYYKDEGKTHIKTGVSNIDFWHYNALDSLITLEAWQKMKGFLEEDGLTKTYERQRDLIHPLLYMGEHGILVDTSSKERITREERAKAEELRKELLMLMPGVTNVNSVQQLQDWFYRTKKVKPYVSRSTGRPTLDKDALKRLSKRGFKEATLLMDYRILTKEISTYLEVEIDKDNRFRMSFNPVGTKQGRLSSSKNIFGTGTNAQNLPVSFKYLLLADPGYVMYNMDLAKAENRIVAYVSPDGNMIEAFEKDIDLHSLTASLISGLSLEDVMQQEANNIPCPLGSADKTWRFWGKKANHGLNYDLGYKVFAFLYEIPEKDAKYIVDKYHQAYSGVRKYHDWIKRQLGATRTLTNVLGRKRRFLGQWGDRLFKEAYSYIPQSTVADIINHRGLLYIWENKDTLFSGLQLLNQVHDSIVFQISLEKSWEEHVRMLLLIKQSLEQPLLWKGRSFFIPVDCEMSKAMKPTKKVTLNSNINSILMQLEKNWTNLNEEKE